MSTSAASEDSVVYHSIQSPHKQHRRRPSYLWKIAISLVVIAAGVALALFHQQQPSNDVSSIPQSADSVTSQVFAKHQQVEESPPHSTKDISASSSSHKVDMDKQRWPELVGVDGEVAKTTIQQENPSITNIQVLPKDSMVTMDYRTDRVRIFVDDDNKVVRAPQIG